jgi:hypothetical protein
MASSTKEAHCFGRRQGLLLSPIESHRCEEIARGPSPFAPAGQARQAFDINAFRGAHLARCSELFVCARSGWRLREDGPSADGRLQLLPPSSEYPHDARWLPAVTDHIWTVKELLEAAYLQVGKQAETKRQNNADTP